MDAWLLEKLVCPVTRGPLVYEEGAGELVSESAGLAFSVRDDVPVLLVEQARVLQRR